MKSRVTRFTAFAIVSVTIAAALPDAWASGQQKHGKSAGKTELPQQSRPQAREVVQTAPELTFVPDTAAVRALYAANQIGDPVAVDKAFADGADPNATVTPHWPTPPDQKAPPEEPAEPLFRMIGYANGEDDKHKRGVRIFRAYLDHGLNLQSKGSDGETPLFHALMLEDDGLIREVVARGADINTLSSSYFGGGNVVNLVVSSTIRGHEEKTLPLLQFFLDKHADPNIT